MKKILSTLITAVVLLFSQAEAQTFNTLDTGAIQSILQYNYPFIYPSSGSLAVTTGVLTMSTALSQIYPNAYIYLPAGAFTGSTAGWYYGQCSSTTLCTMYQNQYTSGLAQTPVSPTLITTGAGAYTQTSGTPILGQQLMFPGNIVGPNGRVYVEFYVTHAATAGTKQLVMLYGGQSCGNTNATTGFGEIRQQYIYNINSTGTQQCYGFPVAGASFFSVDTTQPQLGQIRYILGTATDYIVVTSVNVQITK